MPEVGVEGQRKLKAARVLCIGAGGLGIAGGAVSGGGRRRHARPRRFRQRRREQPAAADPPQHARRRPAEARCRRAIGLPRSTRTSRSSTHEDGADLGERARDLHGLRRHRRRHRQFPDAVSRQRRVRAARQAERLRQHLPLRRPGVGVRGQGRPVLSLPVSRSRRRRGWCRAAPRAACWACCRASSAPSRRPKRSS